MKKKNPPDSTLRNVRAAKKRTLTLDQRLRALTARVKRVEHTLAVLLRM